MLYGKSSFPQPKGPFKFGTGAKANPIQFKNPFFDKRDFIVRIDNPAFSTGGKNIISVDGRKPTAIAVSYKPEEQYSSTGKMTI